MQKAKESSQVWQEFLLPNSQLLRRAHRLHQGKQIYSEQMAKRFPRRNYAYLISYGAFLNWHPFLSPTFLNVDFDRLKLEHDLKKI